jgi:hypothetical protein
MTAAITVTAMTYATIISAASGVSHPWTDRHDRSQLVKWILVALWFMSLPNFLGWLVRKTTGIKFAWLPEVYQLATVGAMVWTIFNPTPSPILLWFALYRPGEILVFVLHWVVAEDKALLDVRRAALGFLINQAEVVLCPSRSQ